MEKESKPADYKANINYGQVGGMRQIKKAYFYTDKTSTEEAKFNGVESVINVLAGFNYELLEILPTNIPLSVIPGISGISSTVISVFNGFELSTAVKLTVCGKLPKP